MPQKTQSARQYARPGCCYELPIEINDDEQTTTTRTRTKPVSVHTATWLEAKARGRWEAPTTTSGEPTPTNTVKCFEEKAGNRLRSSVNRPAVEAEPPQRCRKRAFADVGHDSDENNSGAKRLRWSGVGVAGGEAHPNQHISHTNTPPFLPHDRSLFTNRARIIDHSRLRNHSHPTNRSHTTKLNNENSESDLAELEARLRTMQRNTDLERATIRDIQRAEERANIQDEDKRAREAEKRDQDYRFSVRSSLHMMWKDCDRDREAAEERRNTREREEREVMKMREWQAEQERLQELSNMETALKSMWEAHDRDRGTPANMRPGQLSEAGQRRVRERAEKLRYHEQ